MHRILILILLICPYFLGAQSFKNETDLIKQANESFENEEYVNALPLFSQLVSLHPKSADYNFKFGTCVIYSGVDRETAIKHLNFSIKRSVADPRAYYYMGMAKHLNYEFTEAKKFYSDFAKKADDKLLKKLNAERQIEMCSNGEGLLSSITDLVVLDKKEVSENDFFRYYNLDEIGGSVIAKPEELITKNDKKKGLTGVIHFDRSKSYIYYSSYGKDGDDLDIYRVQPLAGGKFSNPQKLGGEVNTEFDEDFAFMHEDGETLYFSSKGHSSMGGYDVFTAKYDLNTDKYSGVKNLDFAVNTPDDDLFYLVDSTKTMAYFASGRSSALSNLHVYKVRVETLPVNIVLVQGDFISQINESQKNVKITIINDFTGVKLGEFYSNKNTGTYAIPFERSGAYKFEIEAEGSVVIHEGMVEIPSYAEPVAVRQELILSNEGGAEKLQIKNYFDETIDADIASLTRDLLRKKAGLDVNADQMNTLLEQQLENQENETEESEILANNRSVEEAGKVAGFNENESLSDLALQMKTNAEKFTQESDKLKAYAQQAYAEAKAKQALADQKLSEGKLKLDQADESDQDLYIKQINDGNQLLSESRDLSLEAQSLLEVVKSIDTYADSLNVTADKLSNDSEIVASSQEFDEVLEVLKAEKERQRSVSKENDLSPYTKVDKASNFTSNELENLVARIDQLRESETDLERAIDGKNRTLEATKKKSDRAKLEIEIQALENELISTKEDLTTESEKVNALSYDAENYALQREILNNINANSADFKAEPLAYDVSSLNDEIARSNSNAAQAEALIPDETTAVAAASEELKKQVELKTLNKKLGVLNTGVELRDLASIKEGMSQAKANFPELNSPAAEQAQAMAYNDLYVAELVEQESALTKAINSNNISAEEKAYLAEALDEISDEKARINDQEPLLPSISEKELNEQVQTYANDEITAFNNWLENDPTFNDIEQGNQLSRDAVEAINSKISEKNQQVINASEIEEVNRLTEEIYALKSARLYVDSSTSELSYFQKIYESELSKNPENALEIAEMYRELLQNEVIELDEESKNSSPATTAKNLDLKNELTTELTLLDGKIKNMQTQAELAANTESAGTNSVNTENSIEQVLLRSEDISETLMPGYQKRKDDLEADFPIKSQEYYKSQLKANAELETLIDQKITETVAAIDITEDEELKDQLQLQINSLETEKTAVLEESNGYKNAADNIATELAENLAADGQASESENGPTDSETENSLTENEVTENSTTENSETENSLTENSLTDNEETENSTTENSENEDENSLTDNQVTENSTTENSTTENSTTENSETEGENSLTNNQVTENSTTENSTTENSTTENSETENSLTENSETENEGTENSIPELTTDQILGEIQTISTPIRSAFAENVNKAEEKEASEVRYSAAYENLVENDPELNSKLKKNYQIEALSADIDRMQATETDSEKDRAKLDKKIEKFEKKRAKLEIKNAPFIIDASSDQYQSQLADLDQQMNSSEETLANAPHLKAQVRKLRAAAEVYNEDAKIYSDLADKNKDKLKKNELYSESTAKQLAATENLRKAAWLMDNSEELASLSPQTFAAMLEDESLASVEFKTTDNLEVSFADKVLTLADSVKTAEELSAQWNLNDTELNSVRKSTALVEYASKTKQLNQNLEKLISLESQSTKASKEAKNLNTQADKLEKSISTASTETEKEAIEIEVKRIRAAAQVAYETANALKTEKENLLTDSEILKTEITSLSETLSAENILATADTADEPKVELNSASAADMYQNSLDLSTAVNTTIFAKTKNVYSSERPIPVDIKLPEGLVYKVQVGAFRNAIPQTLYNDFAPVSGEKLNNGITRYTAGVFNGESLANKAKKDIRAIGFSDAFVVAYFNGNRISLSEARNLGLSSVAIADTSSPTSTTNNNNTDTEENTSTSATNSSKDDISNSETINDVTDSNSPAANNTNSETESSPSENPAPSAVFNPSESEDDYYESFPNAAEANQVEVLKGLFYTVQIGVYSRPVASNKIYNIAPLNSERLSNGTIRYTTGIYNSLSEASKRKEQIKSIGISDAFITAYYNGKRISISAAKEEFSKEGVDILEVSNAVADARNSSTSIKAESKEYVIYIGTFTDEVPANVAKAMLFLEESRGIVQKRNGSEVSYFTRAVKSEQTAKIIKQEFESYEVFSTEIRVVE